MAVEVESEAVPVPAIGSVVGSAFEGVIAITPKDVIDGAAFDIVAAGASCGDERDVAGCDGVIACAAGEARCGVVARSVGPIGVINSIVDTCGEGDEVVITRSAIDDGATGDGVVATVAGDVGGCEGALEEACYFKLVVAELEVIDLVPGGDVGVVSGAACVVIDDVVIAVAGEFEGIGRALEVVIDNADGEGFREVVEGGVC